MDEHRPAPDSTAASGSTFSLATMLLIVTLFSLWLGILVTLPCVAVGGLVLFAPAVARTVVAVRILNRKEHVTTVGEKLAQLLASMVITCVTCMLSLVSALAAVALAEMIVRVIEAMIVVTPDRPTWMSAIRIVTCTLGLILAAVWGLWLFAKWWPRERDFAG